MSAAGTLPPARSPVAAGRSSRWRKARSSPTSPKTPPMAKIRRRPAVPADGLCHKQKTRGRRRIGGGHGFFAWRPRWRGRRGRDIPWQGGGGWPPGCVHRGHPFRGRLPIPGRTGPQTVSACTARLLALKGDGVNHLAMDRGHCAASAKELRWLASPLTCGGLRPLPSRHRLTRRTGTPMPAKDSCHDGSHAAGTGVGPASGRLRG